MEATTQIYLEIKLEDGTSITGDSSAGGYEGHIDIDSFQFAMKAKEQVLKGVLGKDEVKSNVDCNRVKISKVFDSSSLKLAKTLNNRQKFVEAKISVDQQYIDPDSTRKYRNEIVIIYLYNGYIANLTFSGSEADAGAAIKEDLELSFVNFEIDYYAEERERGESSASRLEDVYRYKIHTFHTNRVEQEA